MSDERLEQIRRRVTGTCSCCGYDIHDFEVGDVLDLLAEADRARRVEATVYAVPPRPWPRAQRMPLAMAGGRVQPWYMQAVAEYDESRGVTTEPNSSIPGMYSAAQVNRAIEWWNERAARGEEWA